jgi:aspartate/methionine/tyrosine aminotransferase
MNWPRERLRPRSTRPPYLTELCLKLPLETSLSMNSRTDLPFALAARNDAIEPFHVMEIVKAAAALQAQGEDVIHMSIGEPDFTAPPAVQAALVAAVQAGQTAYTPALGITPLREAIAAHYAAHGVSVDPARIVITAGASGAMLLALAALVGPGDEVLLPDPTYPCNRHFVSAFGATPVLQPCGPGQAFQLTAADVAARWTPKTRGVMIASPANPTGTSIDPAELAKIHAEVRRRGGFLLVDEIYAGLVYGHEPRSALSLGDDLIVINSFSKYFCMTGWRLGWMVVPPVMVPAVEKLGQNLYICPSALAQHAALACFLPESIAIYEQRRQAFRERRDWLVPALNGLGLSVPVAPDGAFYVYADCSRFAADSEAFAYRVLNDAKVCIVPGRDFGFADPGRYVRLSYATALPRIQEAVQRMAKVLG